jgi:outer membrane protein assembly factor BamA
MGVTGGYLQINVGPGIDERYASTEQVFSPLQAPGINRQANFLRGGPFIQFDYRDHPANPHRGGNYLASYIYYDDRTLGLHAHKKLTAEAQQFIPFFNEKRVIAVRAKTQLSYRNPGQVIPFYIQPVLGGADDLRGFRPFRFYDNNLMVMNAEYRWEVNTGLDMAVFGDAGKVFHRHAELNFANLETSAGFGLRFKSRRAVFMRWDIGFSREGFQVWVKFNPVY